MHQTFRVSNCLLPTRRTKIGGKKTEKKTLECNVHAKRGVGKYEQTEVRNSTKKNLKKEKKKKTVLWSYYCLQNKASHGRGLGAMGAKRGKRRGKKGGKSWEVRVLGGRGWSAK